MPLYHITIGPPTRKAPPPAMMPPSGHLQPSHLHLPPASLYVPASCLAFCIPPPILAPSLPFLLAILLDRNGALASLRLGRVAARRCRHGAGLGLARPRRRPLQLGRAPRGNSPARCVALRPPPVARRHRRHLLVGLGQDQLEDEFVDRSSRTLSCAATPRAFLWLLEGRNRCMDRFHCYGHPPILRSKVSRSHSR